MTALTTAGFARPHENVSMLGIEPGMLVADFGAGSGHYVHAMAEALEGAGHVYAIDVQKDLLRRIHNESHARGHKHVSIVWSDLEAKEGSKIANKHLDLVLISNLLFQIEDKTALLTEAKRILKPTGRLAIIDWADSFGAMGPIKKHVVKKEQALSLANAAGFKLIREFDAGAHHYGLMLRATLSV